MVASGNGLQKLEYQQILSMPNISKNGTTSKFKMTKTFAWIMLGMYAAFFVSATIIAVIHAANTY